MYSQCFLWLYILITVIESKQLLSEEAANFTFSILICFSTIRRFVSPFVQFQITFTFRYFNSCRRQLLSIWRFFIWMTYIIRSWVFTPYFSVSSLSGFLRRFVIVNLFIIQKQRTPIFYWFVKRSERLL